MNEEEIEEEVRASSFIKVKKSRTYGRTCEAAHGVDRTSGLIPLYPPALKILP